MRGAALVLAGLVITTSACQAPEKTVEPPPRVEPGVCVEREAKDQGNLVPDLSSIVDCAAPHVYEVYDIIDLPDSTLTGSTRQARIDNRDDLALPSDLTDDSVERTAFEEFSEQECTTSLQRITGFDELTLRGAAAEDSRVTPSLRGLKAPWYTVMPEKEWLNGRRQVVCSARLEQPEPDEPGRTPVHPQASSDHRMLITRIRDVSLPVEFRQCRSYDAKRREVSPSTCDEPHVDEALFSFEADGVFGKAFISSIRKRPTPKKFDRFDQVCADALPELLGPDYDAKTLRGFGSVASRWTKQSTPVRCAVGPVTFRTADLPPGSLVDSGATKVELVRAK